MELKQQFDQAVNNSKLLSEKPGNDVLLKLYALYKQSTEGDASEAPANTFDFVAKFKYEAWAGIKGTTREDAMKQYVDLVEKLKG